MGGGEGQLLQSAVGCAPGSCGKKEPRSQAPAEQEGRPRVSQSLSACVHLAEGILLGPGGSSSFQHRTSAPTEVLGSPRVGLAVYSLETKPSLRANMRGWSMFILPEERPFGTFRNLTNGAFGKCESAISRLLPLRPK